MSYIKVLALKVSDFESVIVDEKNFKLHDDENIQSWICKQQDNGNFCVQIEMQSAL